MRIELGNKQKSQDGIAIFIVMVSILVLAAMAGIFAYNMRVETQLAMNSNNNAEMEMIGRAGVEYCRCLLAGELSGQRWDALNQKWANCASTVDTNEAVAFATCGPVSVPGSSGTFTWHIIDAERKLNINAVAGNQAIMNEALTEVGFDASEIPTIMGSIQDWIDPDDETHADGAESDYYQSLEIPYYAKNGPIDDITELLLVKGVTRDVFWGTNSDYHQPGMFQRHTSAAQSGLANASMMNMSSNGVAMADLFTAISSGKLNINTCSFSALRAIGMDDSTANHVISMRQGPDGVDGTDDDVPFQNPGEIVNVGLPPQLVSMFMPYLTVRSTTFEIQIDVELGTSKGRYHALIFRGNGPDSQILSFYRE